MLAHRLQRRGDLPAVRGVRLALRVALVATLALVCVPAQAREAATVRYQVNTMRLQTGSPCCFGGIGKSLANDIQTIGQTIRVPFDANILNAFAFRLYAHEGLRFRVYVYRWSPRLGHAVGDPIWRRRDVVKATPGWKTYFYATRGLELKPGKRYVLFYSVSELKFHHGATSAFATADASSYKSGEMVYLPNGYHPGRWTRATWRHSEHIGDMCLRLRFSN